MSRLIACVFIASAGLSCAVPAFAAAEWKWRDASGRIVYSDRPPPSSVPDRAILRSPKGLIAQPVPPSPTTPSLVPGTPATVPSTAAPAPAGAASGAAPRVDKELEERRRKETDAKAAQQKAEEDKLLAARAENCARARGQLRQLDDGIRIAKVNEKGEREILDDKARAAEAARVRTIIASDCKPS